MRIHYIKSQNLLEIPVSGAYGGINTQTGQVAMSVFSERAPLPRVIEYSDNGDPEPKEISRESKEGVVRNVSATLHFDMSTAISLHRWLGEKIKQFEDAHPELVATSKPNE